MDDIVQKYKKQTKNVDFTKSRPGDNLFVHINKSIIQANVSQYFPLNKRGEKTK